MKIYKAGPSLKGCACNLSFNSKDQSYFINLVKQAGWNAEKRLGSFKNGAKCVLKFSVREMGLFLYVLEKNKPLPVDKEMLYHKSGTHQSTIRFAPYIVGEDPNKIQKGYGLSVTQTNLQNAEDKVTFLMPFDFGEAIAFREHLKFAFDHMNSAIYAAEKKAFSDKQAAKKDTPPKEEESPTPKTEETTPEDDTC